MIMLEKIYKELVEENQELYIDRVVDNGTSYLIYISDKFGNVMDTLPWCFDKETGKSKETSLFDYDFLGTECEIPEPLKTYKRILMEESDRFLKDNSFLDMSEEQIKVVVNTLFMENYIDLELSQLFALCNCFIHIVAIACEEDEKDSIFELVKNSDVEEFLKSTMDEKLVRSEEYYYIPEVVQDFIVTTDKILDLAMDCARNEKNADESELGLLKEELEKKMESIAGEIEALDDPICDKNYLQEKVLWLKKQAEMEIQFCENITGQKSERMLDAGDTSISFFEQEGTPFGDFQPFDNPKFHLESDE